MKYSLSHLCDSTLAHDMTALVARERTTTAALLAHLAEFDARRLYLPAAHPSMYSYCIHELRLSEDAASKRIQAARAARRFPGIFTGVAEGRLHLSGVCLLAPHLTPGNSEELLAAAWDRSKAEIERLLAQRFPRPEVETLIRPLPPPSNLVTCEPHAPGHVQASDGQLAPGPVEPSAAGRINPKPTLAPLSPQRFALQLTIGQSTYDKLRYAQELLSHQMPSGDVAAVLDRALDALIAYLEKRKFAATRRPRRPRATRSTRYVPAHVRRAVWQRDGGQCTFVSESGQRCPARKFLEFDHVDPVARGGQATVHGMRLRCRAHNQYGAECAYGAAFMSRKRHEARRATAEARGTAAAEEVIPWLRALGFRADEARRAAARCEAIPKASLEQRVRLALGGFHPGTSAASAGSGS